MRPADLDYLATGKRSKADALRAVIAERPWATKGVGFYRRDLGTRLRKAGATIKASDDLAAELKTFRHAYEVWESRRPRLVEGRGNKPASEYYKELREDMERYWRQAVFATQYASGQKSTRGEVELGTHTGHMRTYERRDGEYRIIVLVLPRDWPKLPLDLYKRWVYGNSKMKRFVLWADVNTGKCVWLQNEQLSGRNRIDVCRGTFGTNREGGTTLTRDYQDKKPRTCVTWSGPEGQGDGNA